MGACPRRRVLARRQSILTRTFRCRNFLFLASLLLIGCVQSRRIVPETLAHAATLQAADAASPLSATSDVRQGSRPAAAVAPAATVPSAPPSAPYPPLYLAPQGAPAPSPEACRLCRARRTSNWITGGICGGILLYGALFWDYGTHSFNAKNDGWFGADTHEGGADKAGHATSAAIATAVFSAVNRRLGIPTQEAALRGALTTFIYTSLVEIGDGFTAKHGWTYGDMTANTCGCIFGYFQETSPRFDQLFDLRWEYLPTSELGNEVSEPSTDYNGSAYVLALNVGALLQPRHRSWLDVVDLQAGYQVRNVGDENKDLDRTVFLGAGINCANLLRRLGVRGIIPKIFEYYQPPYTSLRIGFDL